MAPPSRRPDEPSSAAGTRAEARALRLVGDPAIAARVGRGAVRAPGPGVEPQGSDPVLAATVRAIQRFGWQSASPHPRLGPASSRRVPRGRPGRAARLVYGGGLSAQQAAARLRVSPAEVAALLETAKGAVRPPGGSDRCTQVRRGLLEPASVATGPRSSLVDEVLEHLDRCAECARVADDRAFLLRCLEVGALLSDYQDSPTPAVDPAVVEDHLGGCGACRRRLVDLQAAAATLMESGPGLSLGVVPLAGAAWISARRLTGLRHLAQLAPAHLAGGAVTTALAVATAATVALTAGPTWAAPARPIGAPGGLPAPRASPTVTVTPARVTPRPRGSPHPSSGRRPRPTPTPTHQPRHPIGPGHRLRRRTPAPPAPTRAPLVAVAPARRHPRGTAPSAAPAMPTVVPSRPPTARAPRPPSGTPRPRHQRYARPPRPPVPHPSAMATPAAPAIAATPTAPSPSPPARATPTAPSPSPAAPATPTRPGPPSPTGVPLPTASPTPTAAASPSLTTTPAASPSATASATATPTALPTATTPAPTPTATACRRWPGGSGSGPGGTGGCPGGRREGSARRRGRHGPEVRRRGGG